MALDTVGSGDTSLPPRLAIPAEIFLRELGDLPFKISAEQKIAKIAKKLKQQQQPFKWVPGPPGPNNEAPKSYVGRP